MGYNASFNPIQQANPFSTDKKANPLQNPVISLVPDCNVRSLTRERMESEWQSFINNFGFTVMYKRTNYTLDNHDYLLGEDSATPFPDAKPIKGFMEIINNVQFFSKLGEENKKDIVLSVSIKDYEACWGAGTYPTVGDIFYIHNSDCGDIEKLHPEVYQVTDKSLNEKNIDLLFGGYVWKIYAERFDYSYEKNSFIETGSTSPADNEFSGLLTAPNDKAYTQNVQEEAEKDHTNRIANSIYGNEL